MSSTEKKTRLDQIIIFGSAENDLFISKILELLIKILGCC